MSRKRVLITLPVDAYRRLAAMAEDEERVIDQQASLLLKRLLIEVSRLDDGASEYDDSSSATGANVRGGGLS